MTLYNETPQIENSTEKKSIREKIQVIKDICTVKERERGGKGKRNGWERWLKS